MTDYLAIKNLRKVYNDNGKEFIALDDVSFDIKEGEIVALLGPNGAGKTTIVSIIGGYLLPTSGQVIINGEDVIKTRSRDNIGVSFGGDLGFYGRATAKQNMSFFRASSISASLFPTPAYTMLSAGNPVSSACLISLPLTQSAPNAYWLISFSKVGFALALMA